VLLRRYIFEGKRMFKNPFRKKELDTNEKLKDTLEMVRRSGDRKSELALLLILTAEESRKIADSLDRIYEIFQDDIDEFNDDELNQFPINVRCKIDQLRDCCDHAYDGINNLKTVAVGLVEELPAIMNKKI
jgi:hypothetical protein